MNWPMFIVGLGLTFAGALGLVGANEVNKARSSRHAEPPWPLLYVCLLVMFAGVFMVAFA